MKAYLAFSIHGTNTFITAQKTFSTQKALEEECKRMNFSRVHSRRPGYDLAKDGVKLEWLDLTVKETITDKLGKQEIRRPTRSPSRILSRFKQLEAQGWLVNKKEFIAYHYPRKTKT